jgi:hypothetical protein
MGSVDKILNEFGENLVTDLRNKLRSKGVTFGGGEDSKLAAKTAFNITQKAEGIEFELTMPPEYYWVNIGRKPGNVSKEGKKSIESWATRKAIVGDFIQKDFERRVDEQNARKNNPPRKPANIPLFFKPKLSKGFTKEYKKLKKLPFKKALKALTFIVARGVQKNGYEPTYFLDEVLNDGRLKKLQADINEAGFKDFVTEIKIN